ncbi:E3 ubiquitin-protein ligase Mdm2-like [Lethenteron reissneri]|uniref:E3 ubiquitin-protein ligase Mdm2-like n=1 Tax=Lethenteron reissneri TaxID=7753 RepID=UPI002AB63482|nr:E3 ubiquitin-protein ligase Mdm2-like [Lethenteron reissneri]
MPNHCRDLEENPARSSRRKLSDSAMEAATAPTNKQARTAAWAASQHAATASSSLPVPPPHRPPSPQPPAHPGAGEPRFDSGSDAAGRGFDEEYEVSSVLSDEYYLHDGMGDGDDDEESPCETEFVGADAGGLGSAVLRAHTAFPSGSWRCSECLIVNLLSHRYCLYCWSPRRDSQRDSGIYPGSDSDEEEDDEEVAAVALADAEVGAQEEDVEVVDEEEDEEGDGEGNGEDATAVGHGGGGVKMAARVAKMAAAAAAAAKRRGKQQQEASTAVAAATEERAVAGLTETCVICRVRRRDATIVHGGTGHLVSCFACAQRLHGQHRPCPVCRGPIQLVIRTFVS